MEVNRDVSTWPEDRAGRLDPLHYLSQSGLAGGPRHPAAGVHLDRCQAGLNLLADGVGHLGRFVAANPTVDPDPIAHMAAKKLVNRNAQPLASDVP